ncbi:peptidogalycan biosysnthesis protein [Vibrio coralliilyticus]|uniref:peptidogalycan biosysnthesis protein n=1 Tax=Vibrio coralliilyticus TaxID=190893 RepID=UPI002409CA63|nr:peptidogalycan biosysnthesis protein [Vibrio coralliilyticus]WFB48027.1 peptidogalycan biosysnthesis protein [Vibrio coralliilyticus]
MSKYELKLVDSIVADSNVFFLDKSFTEYQSENFDRRFLVIGVFLKESEELLSSIVLSNTREGFWENPITGAFGGLNNSKKSSIAATEFLITHLVEFMQTTLSEFVISMKIRVAPGCFSKDTALLSNVLYRNKWELESIDLNYHLNIESLDKYLSRLGATKKKQIKRLERSGATFHIESIDNLKQVYQVINLNRSSQGYPMTMPEGAVYDLANRFPERVKLFSVSNESEMIASAICIQVNAEYLYVFYWGEHPNYRSASPVNLIACGIYSYCADNSIKVMDVGTSTVDSVPNYGLCEFKTKLGCEVSQKHTFKWNNINHE